MKQQTRALPPQGSTPDEIYIAVGSALSYWEAAEDVLMGVFSWLCSQSEPTAFEAYVGSPRSRRGEMLKSALERYAAKFAEDEPTTIRNAMRDLDKLASIRNEIAHGHCSEFHKSEDGVTTMSGAYLLPSLNEGRWHQRDLRYAHTAESIIRFREAVRDLRSAIYEAQMAAMMREQDHRREGGLRGDMVRSIAKHIYEGRMSPAQVDQALGDIMAMDVTWGGGPSA